MRLVSTLEPIKKRIGFEAFCFFKCNLPLHRGAFARWVEFIDDVCRLRALAARVAGRMRNAALSVGLYTLNSVDT
jgi:hypothetical protein